MLGIGTHYLDLNDKFSGCVFYRAGLYYPIASKLELSGDLGYFHIENFEMKMRKHRNACIHCKPVSIWNINSNPESVSLHRVVTA